MARPFSYSLRTLTTMFSVLAVSLQPYRVPEMYFFYPSPQETNYWVNIDEVADLKFDAAGKQVSQFEPAVNKYRPDWNFLI